MKTNLKISVVIPVYNAEKFLDKCLNHLICQTYKNLEIIIVDDGSTDGTPKLCREYVRRDKRIKLLRQKNAGPSVALNAGMDAATGDYIHFHDHDDFINLDYYEKMVNAAILTNADILCGEVNQPEYNFPRFDRIEICTGMSDKITKTCANRFNPAWRYLYKKSFLDKTGLRYDEKIFGAQDLFFTKPAIVLATSVATVPGAIYNVVDTATALGKSRRRLKKLNKSPDNRAAREKMREFFIAHGALDAMTAPEKPLRIEEFRMFNIPLRRNEIYLNKTRHYLFGINIGTTRIKR